MKIVWVGAAAGLMAVGSLAMGQMANPPKQSLNGAPGVPANGAAALGRPDANSPAQAGRNALYKYLDDIAAKDEAARRVEIAKIATRAQAEARQQEVRSRILGLMGGGFERTALNAKVTGSTEMEGFRIEKVVYESQPGFYVTALLYVPMSQGSGNREQGTAGAKLPAIVMAPGHGAGGKAGDYAMAATFARNGFVVLSYDPIGQGERLQYPDPKNETKVTAGDPYPGVSLAQRPTGEHGEAGLQPTLIGDAVARYFAWDGVRAVDYLISRPEVDAEKIGAFGCSGGGAMTALLGAADKRVKAVATACYLTTMEELLPSIRTAGCGTVDAGIYCERVRLCGLGGTGGAAGVCDGGDGGGYVPVEGISGDGDGGEEILWAVRCKRGGSGEFSVVSSQFSGRASASDADGADAKSGYGECGGGGNAVPGDCRDWRAWESATADGANCGVLSGASGGEKCG